jgi:hypothetical protein
VRLSDRSHEAESLLDFEDNLAFGEWLHGQLVTAFGVETEAWPIQQINRVERQLQVKRAPADRMKPEILWIATATAFTAPGRYIYISRELQQRAASDDPIAFILAHEMSHHDLGHLEVFGKRSAILGHLPRGLDISLLLRSVEWFFISPEAESAADAKALDLCLAAGYDGKKCLEVFDILEMYALDHRDIDMVFGPDSSMTEDAAGIKRWIGQAKTWGWQRMRRYLPIRDRKAALTQRLLELSALKT